MKILIGADDNGAALRDDLITYIKDLGHDIIDVGLEDGDDYPDVAARLAQRIAAGETDRGILICGTGLGMAITANKVPGVRAATCHDPYSAERVRKSNDAQVITMGAQIVAPTLARTLIDHWLESEFQGGRSTRKVDKMKAIDQKFSGMKE